jgi:hypothetical protein
VKGMMMQYAPRLIGDKGTEPAPWRAGPINKFDSVSFDTDERVTTIFALQTLPPTNV